MRAETCHQGSTISHRIRIAVSWARTKCCRMSQSGNHALGVRGLALLILLACAKDADDATLLRLKAVASYEVPRGFDLAGGLSTQGGVIIWSYVRATLLELSPSGPHQILYPANEPPLAVVRNPSDGNLRVLSGLNGRELTLDQSGALLSEGRVRFDQQLYLPRSAVPMPDGWIIAARDVEGTEHIFCAGARFPFRTLLTLNADSLGAPLPDSLAELRSGLGISRDSTLYVLMRWAPYPMWRIDNACSSSASVRRILHRLPIARAQNDSVQAVALPPVPMPDGRILITIAALRNDTRLLVVVDSDGAVVRSRHVDGALGFLQYDMLTDEVLAARRTDRLEVVKYKVD